jgi:ABC-type uncharacterized transport system auxiliary subunit
MRHRLLLYLPLAACSLPTQEAPQIARFALAASREGAASRPASGPILLVRPFHSGPQCAQRELLWKRGDQVEPDYWHHWLVPPAAALTEITTRWLDRSGTVQAAALAGSRLKATHTLEADLSAWHADVSDPALPKAVASLHLLLLDSEQVLVASREVIVEEPMRGVQPEDYAAAAQRLTARLCTEIEQAVRGAIR